jgi:RNase H-like domain found in reverse transcriptase
MSAAVEQAKAALAAASGLAHPVPHAQIALVTDASDIHVGAVLQQQEGKAWRPLSFFFAEVVACAELLLYLRQRADCCFCCP